MATLRDIVCMLFLTLVLDAVYHESRRFLHSQHMIIEKITDASATSVSLLFSFLVSTKEVNTLFQTPARHHHSWIGATIFLFKMWLHYPSKIWWIILLISRQLLGKHKKECDSFLSRTSSSSTNACLSRVVLLMSNTGYLRESEDFQCLSLINFASSISDLQHFAPYRDPCNACLG
jgi:hypothetical protein